MSDQLDLIDLDNQTFSSNQATDASAVRNSQERYTLSYISSLTLFTLLGYAYIFLFPALGVAAASSLYFNTFAANDFNDITLIIIQVSTLIFSLLMTIYLFQRAPTLPAGRPVTSQDAPRLIQLVTELCAELHLTTIHRIRVTREFELSLVRTPKSGFPFRTINTLIIGLPLMQCLTPVQFRSAVHRELVHLSGPVTRPGRWFYFARQKWTQYQNSYQSDFSIPTLIMRIFFSWYAPLYRFYSKKAARHEELYADDQAFNTIKDNGFVDMLTAVMLGHRFLEQEYWPSLNIKAYKYHTPPYMPYSCLEIHFRNKLLPRIAQQWIDESLQTKPTTSTMPDFYSRINKLDVWNVILPHTSEESAASYFLDDSCDTIIDQMDQVWFKSQQYKWQQRFKKGQLERNKLKELKLQASQGMLSDIKTWEYIQLIGKYVERHEAILLYKKLLDIQHKDSRIYFEIGRGLISCMDAGGIQVLEQSMTLDKRHTVAACNMITQFYVQTGKSRFAQPYRRRALAYQVEAA